MSLATITLSGRAFFGKSLKEQILHIAWGEGDPNWDILDAGDLPSVVENTSLVAELGRRIPNGVDYVLPDLDGDISIPVGMDGQGNVQYQRYTASATPTPYLYIHCTFDNDDAAENTIREVALFGGSVIAPGLPPGQRYFAPDEIIDPGFLIAMEIVRPAWPRSLSVRETYGFVLPV
ncbi:MAG: hypothetical protein LBH14_04040 [Desulfobulbaceae bacterium]|jgi:hypothetical protein|nr:hypothetical protein [Desulfobulbaceae bacterium]